MELSNREALVRASVQAFNDEAAQAYLKALTGGEGSWKRHEPRTNLSDLLGSHTNDNLPLDTPVQLDLFPETLSE